MGVGFWSWCGVEEEAGGGMGWGVCVLSWRVEGWIQRDLFPMQELNVSDEGEKKELDDKVTTWSKTMQGTSRVGGLRSGWRKTNGME